LYNTIIFGSTFSWFTHCHDFTDTLQWQITFGNN